MSKVNIVNRDDDKETQVSNVVKEKEINDELRYSYMMHFRRDSPEDIEFNLMLAS